MPLFFSVRQREFKIDNPDNVFTSLKNAYENKNSMLIIPEDSLLTMSLAAEEIVDFFVKEVLVLIKSDESKEKVRKVEFISELLKAWPDFFIKVFSQIKLQELAEFLAYQIRQLPYEEELTATKFVEFVQYLKSSIPDLTQEIEIALSNAAEIAVSDIHEYEFVTDENLYKILHPLILKTNLDEQDRNTIFTVLSDMRSEDIEEAMAHWFMEDDQKTKRFVASLKAVSETIRAEKADLSIKEVDQRSPDESAYLLKLDLESKKLAELMFALVKPPFTQLLKGFFVFLIKNKNILEGKKQGKKLILYKQLYEKLAELGEYKQGILPALSMELSDKLDKMIPIFLEIPFVRENINQLNELLNLLVEVRVDVPNDQGEMESYPLYGLTVDLQVSLMYISEQLQGLPRHDYILEESDAPTLLFDSGMIAGSSVEPIASPTRSNTATPLFQDRSGTPRLETLNPSLSDDVHFIELIQTQLRRIESMGPRDTTRVFCDELLQETIKAFNHSSNYEQAFSIVQGYVQRLPSQHAYHLFGIPKKEKEFIGEIKQLFNHRDEDNPVTKLEAEKGLNAMLKLIENELHQYTPARAGRRP